MIFTKSTPDSTVFYVLRHGETEWNLQGRIQGHLDSPLTQLGEKQARAVGEAFAGCGASMILCSDLARAVRTAEIIAGFVHAPVASDHRLRERNLGVMEGLTMKEFSRQFSEDYAQFSSGNPEASVTGGESIRERYDRSIGCFDDIARHHKGKEIIVVTHGGVLDSVFRHSVGLPLTQKRRFTLYNGSINTIEISNGVWRMINWGYTDHLAALETLDDS